MRCQVCDTDGQNEGDPCPYCGAVVRSLLGKGPPLPCDVADEAEKTRRERESDKADRRRSRYRRHSVAGAIIFGALGLIVFLLELLLTVAIGIAGRETAGDFVLRLVLSFVLIPVYAAFLGAPMGLFISWRRLSFAASGLLGACVFSVCYFFLGMHLMFGPIQTPITVFSVVVFGVVFGAVLSVNSRIDSD